MRSGKAINLALRCIQGDRVCSSMIYLEDHWLSGDSMAKKQSQSIVHPHDNNEGKGGSPPGSLGTRTLAEFRSWLQKKILAELDL